MGFNEFHQFLMALTNDCECSGFFRTLQKAGFNRLFLKLFVTVSFYIIETVTNVTNCKFAKSGHNEDGYVKLQTSFINWLYCD
jgi:hypothetical protein